MVRSRLLLRLLPLHVLLLFLHPPLRFLLCLHFFFLVFLLLLLLLLLQLLLEIQIMRAVVRLSSRCCLLHHHPVSLARLPLLCSASLPFLLLHPSLHFGSYCNSFYIGAFLYYRTHHRLQEKTSRDVWRKQRQRVPRQEGTRRFLRG